MSKVSREILATIDFKERIINIARVAKVVRGGRRFSFSAIVAVGDDRGVVGFGLGKANEVPETISKATQQAKKTALRIPLAGSTIPHEVVGCYGAAKVIMKPASEGTGVIAGGAARVLLELSGIKDVLCKAIGTTNPHNLARATMDALKKLHAIDDRRATLRTSGSSR